MKDRSDDPSHYERMRMKCVTGPLLMMSMMTMGSDGVNDNCDDNDSGGDKCDDISDVTPL